MASKPTTYINWVPSGNAAALTQPPVALSMAGWTAGEAPPYQYENWLMYTLDQWIQYLDQTTNAENSAVSNDDNARLLGGGTWAYTNATGTLSWSQPFNIAWPSVADSANQIAAGSLTLADGQVMVVVANVPFNTVGNTVLGNNTLTNLAYTTGISVGMQALGNGIPVGTTVSVLSGSTVTLSAQATASNTGTALTFVNVAALTPQAATESTLLPVANQLVVARRVGATVIVGISAGEMLLRDGEQKTLRGAGYDILLSGTAGVALPAGTPVYMSPGSGVDAARTAGSYYPTESSAANGAVRGQLVGVVLTTAASGTPVTVITGGIATPYAGLTPGSIYYQDPTTPGNLVSTKPSSAGQYVVAIGTAVGTTQLLLNDAGGAANTVITTGAAQGNYGVTNETQLAAALANCVTNGGGVIVLQAAFTISAFYTIPTNTVLLGQLGQSIITCLAGSQITLGTNAFMRDVFLTTALMSGTLVAAPNYYGRCSTCSFTVPPGGVNTCIYVTGNGNRFSQCVFVNVAGQTATGINYAGGASNIDDSSVFL